jgi:hypothetical protein
MALPPWTRELFSGSLDDVAKRLQNTDTLRELQNHVTNMLGDLPVVAARGIDRLMQETRKGTEQVRRWVRRQTSMNTAAINGSGVFFHPLFDGSPIDSLTDEHDMATGQLFTLANGIARQRIEDRLTKTIHGKVRCHSLLARSTIAAMVAVGASLRTGSAIVLPRMDSLRLDGEIPLPEALRATGRHVQEIGSGNTCTTADWILAGRQINDHALGMTIRWPKCKASDPVFVAQHNTLTSPLRHVEFVPYGCFDAPLGLPTEACSLIDNGFADQNFLTIVPTNSLLGGPRGALILGSEAALNSVQETAVWPALKAELHTVAAFVKLLEHQSGNGPATSALSNLLQVSVENLANRAERLATQLAGESAIISCRISEDNARLSTDLPLEVPSRQLKIVTKQDVQRVSKHLEADSPGLVLNVVAGELSLDFRWIPSHLDSHLAGLLTGHDEEASEDSASA